MIRISQLKVPINLDTPAYIKNKIQKLLGLCLQDIICITPVRRSIDARKKSNLLYVYNFDVSVRADEEKVVARCANVNITIAPHNAQFSLGTIKADMPPVICGMGPAGLFCAYALALSGANPILIERGKSIDERVKDTQNFMCTGTLNPESNIQFGEGGAGTFSDGKLTTGTSNNRLGYILKTFVECGAPENILYDAKPHIGTDVLRNVIKNIRNKILEHGGQILFETKLTNIHITNNAITSITVIQHGAQRTIPCKKLILAIGHSARDTFELLHEKNLNLQQKQFSMGVRIEHNQHTINMAQYGTDALGAADYKLAVKTKSGRGVYTFCMCPGGHVIAAASEEGGVVTNGMSYHAREGENANAALLCDVYPSDFNSDHPLAGIYLQRKHEKLAYECGGKNYNAPASLVGDFLSNTSSEGSLTIQPTYEPNVTWCNVADCLPSYVADALREALPMLGRKLKGFDAPDAVLTGIESRSSSPVRIVRNASLQSNIIGIYPCGEGAGYAGGIMSAAADGLLVAQQIVNEFCDFKRNN